jgi:DNA invertase Pin-like site-specific DNA recombinase
MVHRMTATATKVVGYVRVSTDKQAERGVSLAAQESKLRAYAVAMELELVEVVVDDGFSAKTLNRPGLARVLAMLDAGAVDGVLVAKLDRLTRSVRDLGTLVERYFASRCALLSVADSIDTRSAAGRLVLNVLASVAQWEREATAERTCDALAHLKAEGVQLGGAALGWTRTNETDAEGRRVVVRVADEEATLARIRELRAHGASFREICDHLTAEGRPTKRGGKWSAQAVSNVLRREGVA